MSDYFTKHNTIEVGPGPEKEIEWLVVQQPEDMINGVTHCCTVKAKTFHLAMQKAERFIPELSRQKTIVFPNPVLEIIKRSL